MTTPTYDEFLLGSTVWRGERNGVSYSLNHHGYRRGVGNVASCVSGRSRNGGDAAERLRSRARGADSTTLYAFADKGDAL